MAGRHSITAKASLDTLNLTQTRAAIAATAFGAMFSMALPATADADLSGAEALAAMAVTEDANQAKQADTPASTTPVTAANTEDGDSASAPSFNLEVENGGNNADLPLEVEVPQEPVIEQAPQQVQVPQQIQQQAAPATTQQIQQQAAPAAAQQAAAPAAADPAPAPASAIGQAVVAYGRQFIGVPYVYGGASPAGMDCSGFVSYVYARFGYSLPHSSSGIRYSGRVVPASQAQPGDVMWWPGHVAIFTGHSQLEAVGYGVRLSENPIRGGATFIRIVG